MEQRELWADNPAKPVGATVQTIRFGLAAGRFCEMDARTGNVLSSHGDVTAAERANLELIRKDYGTGWNGFSYVIRSALHKEVRRGDIAMASRWGKLLALASGEPKVRAYVKQILFEETRNLSLLSVWKGARGFDADTMVRQITASTKKWEMEERRGAFERYVFAYMRALPTLGKAFPKPDEIQAAVASADLDQLYEMFWRIHISQNTAVLAAFDNAIRVALSESGDDNKETFSNLWPTHFYTTKVGCELLAGVWSGEANRLVRDMTVSISSEPAVIDVPHIEEYAYDNHTRPGLVKYVANLKNAHAGKKLPSGVDLRWSGMVRGACWREYAHAQHGADYVNTPWEKVEIPKDVWNAVVHVDGFFYGSLYRRAGIRGIPDPRG